MICHKLSNLLLQREGFEVRDTVIIHPTPLAAIEPFALKSG